MTKPAEIDERWVMVKVREDNDGIAVEVRRQILDDHLRGSDLSQGARAENREAVQCSGGNVSEHWPGHHHTLGARP